MANDEMYNPKIREVWCPKCKVYTERDDQHPKCLICQNKLITVLKSVITGERITGAVK